MGSGAPSPLRIVLSAIAVLAIAYGAQHVFDPPREKREGGFHYPPAPSLAGDVSDARARFIDVVDRTCVDRYDDMIDAEEAAAREYEDEYDSEIVVMDVSVTYHQAEYDALRALGPAPDGGKLYEEWLGNMKNRIRLARSGIHAVSRGDYERADEIGEQIDDLKVAGNLIGQRFGLRLCTSNGPERTLVKD